MKNPNTKKNTGTNNVQKALQSGEFRLQILQNIYKILWHNQEALQSVQFRLQIPQNIYKRLFYKTNSAEYLQNFMISPNASKNLLPHNLNNFLGHFRRLSYFFWEFQIHFFSEP